MPNNWNTLRTQIEKFSKPFPTEAIAFANAHREELAPHLIEVLKQVAADPSVTEDPDYVLHLFALHLLASWADPRAYAPMAALGHHDEDTLDILLGDTLTESYGRCLAAVCGGDLGLLKALFEDAQACHWSRSAALNAMLVRVLEGDDSRDALVQYLTERGDLEAQRLRELGADRDALEVIDLIVHMACILVAVELHERIASWFDDGLLDLSPSGRARVDATMALSFETARVAALQSSRGYVRDVQAEMGSWSGYQDAKPSSGWAAGGLSFDRPPEVKTAVRAAPKVGRNDPCPCGSGKKYKKCCGAS